MIANYGYQDASGEYFIAVDAGRCDGCGRCVTACPAGAMEVAPNPYDPLDDRAIAAVSDAQRNLLKETCSACQTAARRGPVPCVAACPQQAITHW